LKQTSGALLDLTIQQWTIFEKHAAPLLEKEAFVINQSSSSPRFHCTHRLVERIVNILVSCVEESNLETVWKLVLSVKSMLPTVLEFCLRTSIVHSITEKRVIHEGPDANYRGVALLTRKILETELISDIEEEKNFHVDVVRVMLETCERSPGKPNKAFICEHIYEVTVSSKRFMCRHERYCVTVMNKLVEQMAEEFGNVRQFVVTAFERLMRMIVSVVLSPACFQSAIQQLVRDLEIFTSHLKPREKVRVAVALSNVLGRALDERNASFCKVPSEMRASVRETVEKQLESLRVFIDRHLPEC
jgi:hypothetical protein